LILAEEAAREYLEKTKRRSRWDQFLHGIAATHELGSEFEAGLLRAMKRKAPTPEDARDRCPLSTVGIPDAYNKKIVVESICRGAAQWEKIKSAQERCDSEWVAKNVYGLKYKGADMLMILSGCNTVVGDRLMIKLIKPGINDSAIRRIQRSKRLYNEVKSELMKKAEKEGVPYNFWHVKEWLKLAEAPVREGPKKWVERLFK